MKKIEIDFYNKEKTQWVSCYKKYIKQVFKHLRVKKYEITVLFCNDSYIKNLNQKHRNKDEATDILSFSYNDEGTEGFKNEEGKIMGDLVISLDTLKSNGEYFKVSQNEELKRITIHGILHLQGFDHLTNDQNEGMLLLQEKILNMFLKVSIFNE